MPLVKKVKSLLKLCLKRIQINIENNNCAAAGLRESASDQNCQCVNSEQLIDSVATVGSPESHNSSFHDLPTNLLEDIIKSFNGWDKTGRQRKNPLENVVLDHLFTSQLTILWCCPYRENYLDYFRNFGKLQVLNISANTTLGDDCFKLIGTYCKFLRVLNANGCLNVTDSGVRWLCVGFDNLEVEKGGQCKLIEKLEIFVTKVTTKGIKMALTHLPALKILEHETTFAVLTEMIVCHKPILTLRFPLTKLRISIETSCCDFSLAIWIYHCPMLSNIIIHFNNAGGLKNINILHLQYVKKLRELTVSKNLDCQVTFDCGLAPLLKVSGNVLEKLDISSLFDTTDDIWTIIECCPNLRVLNLLKNSKSSQLEEETDNFNAETKRNKNLILKELQYLDCSFFNLPPNILLLLLSSPSLVDIAIRHCESLTNNILQDAAKLHNFHNLENFHLSNCCAISYKGIDALMVDGNSLYQVSIHDCKEITLDNVLYWKTKAEKKNWKLCFNFFYFDNISTLTEMQCFSFGNWNYNSSYKIGVPSHLSQYTLSPSQFHFFWGGGWGVAFDPDEG